MAQDKIDRRKAVLSFKVTESELPNSFEKPKSPMNDNGFSRSTNLSVLYGIIVVLVGLVVPMTEALRSNWMSSHLVAVFLAYLYSVASVFIGYMHIHEAILKRASCRLSADMSADMPADMPADSHQGRAEDDEDEDDDDYNPQKTYDRFHALRTGINNLSMIEDDSDPMPSSSKSSNSDEDDTKSVRSLSSDKTQSTIVTDEGKSKRVSFAQDTSFTPMHSDRFRRRRFSTLPTLPTAISANTESTAGADQQTPDDVYNYIAMNNATATMVGEGTGFFMKGGSLIFAIANMVYVSLRIEGEHQIHEACHGKRIIYPHYLHLVFIVMQSFFLLKECQFVYRENKSLVRFGLVHLIATNLCVWLRYLMIEVDESLMHQKYHDDKYHVKNDNNSSEACNATPIMLEAGPYLFPFVLEYSLVASSTAAFIYSSINIRVTTDLYQAVCNALKRRRDSEDLRPDEGSYMDPFSKSHMGLFAGVVVFAGVIISMIFFFYWNGKHEELKATLCYRISETVLLFLLLFATFFAAMKFSSFMVDLNESNTLDHGMLLVTVSLYIVLESFKLISTCVMVQNEGSNPAMIMKLVVSLTSIVQCISQTVFIIDGMQRVAIKQSEMNNKYARGTITFLIVANVAAWVFKSFQEKRADSEAELDFYGGVAWTIISSTALPLILFYRFHSSICLAHMWRHCYERREDQILEAKMLV